MKTEKRAPLTRPTELALAALGQLLRAAIGVAERLSVRDVEAKRELVETLHIAQINVLRILGREAGPKQRERR